MPIENSGQAGATNGYIEAVDADWVGGISDLTWPMSCAGSDLETMRSTGRWAPNIVSVRSAC